jgi:proteasome accessory factor B/proteasome accessory factor C
VARGAERRLRIDRMQEAVPTGEAVERPTPATPPADVFSPGASEATEVTLVLPPSARWVVEAYDVLSTETLPDGRLRVRLLTAGEHWLERLLLNAGPDAQVESPVELARLGAAAARRVLARYR